MGECFGSLSRNSVDLPLARPGATRGPFVDGGSRKTAFSRCAVPVFAGTPVNRFQEIFRPERFLFCARMGTKSKDKSKVLSAGEDTWKDSRSELTRDHQIEGSEPPNDLDPNGREIIKTFASSNRRKGSSLCFLTRSALPCHADDGGLRGTC
ncbi:unnamed protein product [Victoria cruziana]